MYIHCLGLNHHTADVCLREQIAFSEESVKAALARLGCGDDNPPVTINEMIILSTCNRVEIYAVAAEPDFEALEKFLAEVKGLSKELVDPHLYRLLDREAVAHLFRVAAGLDSLVLGEPQILGQVMKAFELARSQNAAGPVLSKLFQAALFTGKRARTETAISQNPASISSVAARLIEDVIPHLTKARVGVLGAGEMAELAVEALRKRGVHQLVVINRTLERARSLADRWVSEAATFENLGEVLTGLDVLITSTGAPHTILPASVVKPAMALRPERPLLIIDIAVPRDVDEAVGQIPGVLLYNMDMLHRKLEASISSRAQEVPQVEAILRQEEERFLNYLQTLDIIPIIAEMRQRAEAIRQAELEKTLRRMGDLSPEERKHLEAMTQALVKKILHAPISRLREEAGSPSAAQYASTARRLFDLEM